MLPFHEIQNKMAESLLNAQPLEKIDLSRPENWETYQDLIFNVYLDAMETAFPICQKWVGEECFEQWVRQWMKQGGSAEHAVWKMPVGFLNWFQETKPVSNWDADFISELMQFEWTETELFAREDEGFPEFEILQLHYPVHALLPGEKIPENSEIQLLLFRSFPSGEIRIQEILPMFSIFIQALEEGAEYALIQEWVERNYTNQSSQILKSFLDFLQDLSRNGFLFSHQK